MTRKDLLNYIARVHGNALAQVGLMPVDADESLHYVIDDALRMSNDDKRKAEADRRVAQLIHDRRDALDIDEEQPEVADDEPQPVEIEV